MGQASSAEHAPRSWRYHLHRWRWWLLALGLIIAVRVALPIVLRRVIASQASQALHARVDVGDVALALYKGGVALRDVAVRAADAPPPPAVQPANAPAFADNPPLIAFKRFAVELRYWPLFSKTIEVRSIELESPRVALDRLASGDLNLMALVPKSEVAVQAGATPGAIAGSATPTPTVAAAAAAASPWKLGLDRFVLRDGRLRFRDLELQGSEPIEIGIDQIMVQEISLTPGLYGEPAHVHVKLGLDEGAIDVAAQLQLLEKGMAVTCDLKADRLPLRRARLYVPKVGWSDLEGELDLALTYELQTETKNQLHGSFALRDVSVAVPHLQDVAMKFSSLGVGIEMIDLLAQRAAISDVKLDGAKLYVRAEGDQPLPVLAQSAPPPSAETPGAETPGAEPPGAETPGAATPTPTPESPTPEAEGGEKANAPPAEPAKPWDWQVANVQITNSTVEVLSNQPPMAVGVELNASNLAAAADAVAHVALGLTPPQGTLKLEGDLRIAAPAFGGTLQINGLALPPLLAVSGRVDPAVLPSAVFKADLAVQAGLPAKSDASAEPNLLRVKGALGLSDVRAVPPGQGDLAVEAKGLDLTISDLAVPGVIPVGHKAEPGAAVHAAVELKLDGAQITRGGDQTMSAGAQSLDLALSEASVPAAMAGLGPAGGAQSVHVAAELKLGEPQFSRGGDQAMSAGAQSLDLAVSDATVPAAMAGIGPAEGAQSAHVAAELKLDAPQFSRGGDQAMSAGAQSLDLTVSDATVPAVMTGGPGEGPQPLHAVATLALAEPRVALTGADLAAEAHGINLAVTDASLTAVPAGAAAAGAPPARVAAKLDLDTPKVSIAQGKQLAASAKAIAFDLPEFTLPGFVVGAPPADTGEPMHAVATLTLTQPSAVRADGKEFSFAAQAIAVPLTDLSMPSVLVPAAPAAPPLRAALANVGIDAPAIRLTRTKDGIVLPMAGGAPAAASPAAASPTPAPAPASAAPANRPAEISVASFRLSKGSLDFTDRAVQPAVEQHFAPIEVDARNIRLPNPAVKPLRVEITTAEQGKIVMTGDFGPQGGALDMTMNDFALSPFSPYASSYSPYSIDDGSLEIKTKATFSGGKYDVTNKVTLHQFDLGGAEGDSVFEQQFGIPLSMALALLRDASGDIDLTVPVQVDQSGGANVDVLSVVRSALRQAMMGAIESPLKLVGGVIGVGGKPGAIAPAPIAFRLGQPQPTDAGAESAARLAAFLSSRPGMAVELDTAITADDVRWLHEQALRGEWQDQGLAQKALAFVTQRGPRQRIGSYLAARAEGEKAELSPEDSATLQQELDKHPPPSNDQLHALAQARLAAVDSALQAKGIDAARISHGQASDDAAEGTPLVRIKFRQAAKAAVPAGPPSTTSEEGQ